MAVGRADSDHHSAGAVHALSGAEVRSSSDSDSRARPCAGIGFLRLESVVEPRRDGEDISVKKPHSASNSVDGPSIPFSGARKWRNPHPLRKATIRAMAAWPRPSTKAPPHSHMTSAMRPPCSKDLAPAMMFGSNPSASILRMMRRSAGFFGLANAPSSVTTGTHFRTALCHPGECRPRQCCDPSWSSSPAALTRGHGRRPRKQP